MTVALLDTAATLSAVALAAVLTMAAIVKLTSLQAAAGDFAALGLGRSKVLPALVGTTEVVAAVALMLRPPVGAAAAGVLLVAFTGVVTWALATGRQVSCGCFGPLSREPVSSATVTSRYTSRARPTIRTCRCCAPASAATACWATSCT